MKIATYLEIQVDLTPDETSSFYCHCILKKGVEQTIMSLLKLDTEASYYFSVQVHIEDLAQKFELI